MGLPTWLRITRRTTVSFLLGIVMGVAVLVPKGAMAHSACSGATYSIGGTMSSDMLEGDGGDNAAHDHKDEIDGYDGALDVIKGFTCNDFLYGGQGPDEVRGSYGADLIHGNEGLDNVANGGGLYLGNGNDTAYGDDARDFLISLSDSPDDDSMHGEQDDDEVNAVDSDVQDTAGGGGGVDECWIDFQDATGNTDNATNCETVHEVH
jgi:hypothetical protein